jgi:hypothetical protein
MTKKTKRRKRSKMSDVLRSHENFFATSLAHLGANRLTEDERLVTRLLLGRMDNDHDIRQYPGPAAELECRRALARLLRAKANGEFPVLFWMLQLADLFDPDADPVVAPRTVKFHFRSTEQHNNFGRDIYIMRKVEDKWFKGSTITAAISAVAKDNGLSVERVKQIWRDYKNLFRLGTG